MSTRTHRPGTYSGYNWHMEQRAKGQSHEVCPPCKRANAIQMDLYRKKLYLNGGKLNVPAIGTQRRLQALQAMGWNYRDLGRRYGKDGSVLSNIANSKEKAEVYRETAEKISAMYDELSMIPPDDDWLTRRTAKMARERGYVLPLCWEDETIDDPYGLPVGLSHVQAYTWFWKVATMRERIEWSLEHGLTVARRKFLW